MSFPSRCVFRLFLLSGLLIVGMGGAARADFFRGQDNFADATAIDVNNGRSEFTFLEDFTQETGEPGHRPNGVAGARRSAWWKWTAPDTGFCTVDTRLSLEFTTGIPQTCLSVYQGTAVNALTRVASGDAYSFIEFHPDARLSSVTFHAVKGTEYYFAADAFRSGVVGPTFQGVVLQVRLFPFRKVVRRSSLSFFVDGTLVDLGSINVISTGTGRLTGKLTTKAKTYSFAGAAGTDGRFTTTFEAPQSKAGAPQELPVTLILDLAGVGSFALYKDNLVIRGVLPEVAFFPASAPTVAEGTYTVTLPKEEDSGSGSLSFSIKGNGSIRGTGFAPDGSAFSFSSALHLAENDESKFIPIYVPLYGKKGGLSGVITHRKSDLEAPPGGRIKHILGGTVQFLRPVLKGTFHPAGVAESLDVFGGTYFPPTAEEVRPFGFLNPDGLGRLRLFAESGELETTLSENLTLEAKGKFVFESRSLKPTLKLNLKTGLVTGSITEPGKKKRTLKGVIFETDDELLIIGMATGRTSALTFLVEPRE